MLLRLPSLLTCLFFFVHINGEQIPQAPLQDESYTCTHPPYKVHVFSKSPLVIYITNFITPEERAHLLGITYVFQISSPPNPQIVLNPLPTDTHSPQRRHILLLPRLLRLQPTRALQHPHIPIRQRAAHAHSPLHRDPGFTLPRLRRAPRTSRAPTTRLLHTKAILPLPHGLVPR
jgi:hypothetical protein